MIKPAKVHTTPIEATERLRDLELSTEELHMALDYGYRYYADCTSHDPITTPGYIAYAKITRALRDILALRGWQASNRGGYATVVHPRGKIALVVAGGDTATGKDGGIEPHTRSSKGYYTKRAIAYNQYTLADYNPDAFGPLPISAILPPQLTWTLLHRYDLGVIKSELSLATNMDEQDYVNVWQERIILPDIPFDASSGGIMVSYPPPIYGGDLPEIDVPVEKKEELG